MSSSHTRFLGRQPILDGKFNIYGHELLYSFGSASDSSIPPDQTIRGIIDDALLLVTPSSTERLFLKCDRTLLMSGLATLLPPPTTVLEIIGEIEPDAELIECCQSYKISGFSFALDKSASHASMLPLLESADFIKINFQQSDSSTRRLQRAAASNRRIKLIASGMETEAAVEQAWQEGCTFFQGHFFCQPIVSPPRAIPQNEIIYVRLLAELSREPADIDAIEQLAKSEPSVCYRLLRLVNSVLYAIPSPVSSIRSAVMMIGEDEFRKLVTVALASIAASPRSKSASRVALVRAKFCELLAPAIKQSPSMLYLLGMLSLMDVILTMPMRQVVELLPLHDSMKAALLGKRNALSVALDLVRARESGGWLETTSIQESLNLRGDVASRLYADSIRWADTVDQIT